MSVLCCVLKRVACTHEKGTAGLMRKDQRIHVVKCIAYADLEVGRSEGFRNRQVQHCVSRRIFVGMIQHEIAVDVGIPVAASPRKPCGRRQPDVVETMGEADGAAVAAATKEAAVILPRNPHVSPEIGPMDFVIVRFSIAYPGAYSSG